MTLPSSTPSNFRLFLAAVFNRNNIANAAFVGGIAAAAYGAEMIGRTAFDMSGAGWLLGGLLAVFYGYLLGSE